MKNRRSKSNKLNFLPALDLGEVVMVYNSTANSSGGLVPTNFATLVAPPYGTEPVVVKMTAFLGS